MKNKIPVILISIFVVVGLGFGIYYGVSYRESTATPDERPSEDFGTDNNEFLEYLLDYDESYYDEGYVESYYNNQFSVEADTLKEEEPLFYNFVMGILDVHHGDSEDACIYFKEALSAVGVPYISIPQYVSELTFSETSLDQDHDMLTSVICGRIYYELARYCVNQEYYNSAQLYYDYMFRMMDGEDAQYYAITYGSWAVYDAMMMEDGADYAVSLAEEIMDLAEDYSYDDMLSIYQVVADAYANDDNIVPFVEYELLALDEALQQEDTYNQVAIYSALGYVYLDDNDDYDTARNYLLKAYALTVDEEAYGEGTEAEMKCYVTIGLSLTEMKAGDTELALTYLEEAETWNEKETDISTQLDDKVNLQSVWADYYLATGDLQSALDAAESAMGGYERAENFSYSNYDLELYNLFGRIYYAKKDYEKSLEYYKKTYTLASERGQSQNEEAIEGIYYDYKALGDSENAYKFAEILIDYKDSIYERNRTSQAAYLLEEFESDKKDEALSEQETQIAQLQSKSFHYAVIIVVAIVLIAGFLFLLQYMLRSNAKIRKLSERDALTGLYNRRTLDSFLTEKWAGFLKDRSPVTVAMFDVDFFKLYNDNYGHQKGDEALTRIAEIFRKNAPEGAFTARYGGEEFLMILPDCEAARAAEIMRGIQIDIKTAKIAHAFSKVSDSITVSIGYVVTDSDTNYEHAIQCADQALYMAKVDRNTIHCYDGTGQ